MFDSEWRDRYNQLDENYTKLNEKYAKLEIENQQLKAKQAQLSVEIAKYFAEQTAIDIFGLKKYQTLYDLVKITYCNQVPQSPLC